MSDQQAARMIEFIASCEEPAKLRTIASNASAKGVEEVFRAAKLRLFEILPQEEPGTMEYHVWQAIYALEDALSEERGKTIRLARTRQKIARQGELACVADLVLGSPSEGFRMLVERDMLDLSFEAVALKHPHRFDEAVLAAARERLADVGFSPTQ